MLAGGLEFSAVHSRLVIWFIVNATVELSSFNAGVIFTDDGSTRIRNVRDYNYSCSAGTRKADCELKIPMTVRNAQSDLMAVTFSEADTWH